jgi:hypothetical protein
MAREGVSASGLAKPLVDDVIATVVLVRSGASRWGYGATLTFCECGHQALGRRHGCRYVPRSCSPPPNSPTAWRVSASVPRNWLVCTRPPAPDGAYLAAQSRQIRFPARITENDTR